jgi:hypothetical protein
MKHHLLFALIVSLGALSAANPVLGQPKAAAGQQKELRWDWWNVYSAGQSPDREVIFINERSVEAKHDLEALKNGTVDFMKPPPYIEADGVSVFENTNKPARINGRVRVNCATQQMMFLKSWRLNWQVDRSDTTPPTQWFNADTDLKFMKIALFLCAPKARTEKNLMVRADQAEDPLEKTWAVLWSDVQKPKFKTNKTLEQAQADFNKQVARGEAIIAEGTKKANETQARILRDEKVTEMEQKALFSKMRSKASPLLNSWLGAEERALVASWGVPNSSHNAANARFLSYVYGFERQYRTQDGNGNVVASSRDEFSCNMTFEVRDGVVKDYRSDGNYCRSAASSLSRGPN